MTDTKVAPELVAYLAEMTALDIPGQVQSIVAELLEQQLREFRRFGLAEPLQTDPEICFDPRW
jgi:hypothetical protein